MRVLIAPDCFGAVLSAPAAAAAMRDGWLAGAPDDQVTVLPLADGGPGFCEVMAATVGGQRQPQIVTGPLREPVPASLLLVDTEGGRRTAYVESATAAGLAIVPDDRRDPRVTTSRGVGELIAAAIAAGATRVVVGVGGTAVNDAGAGLLAALAGLAADHPLAAGGGRLGSDEITATMVEETVRAAMAAVAGVDLVAAVDVDVPLLGLHGASAGFAAQKGATAAQAQELERSVGRFAAMVEAVPGAGAVGAAGAGAMPQLLAPSPVRLSAMHGAGAGGGIGFALATLGARLLPGAEVVASAVGLVAACHDADIVVTGEGRLDWGSLHGKVVSAVANAAARAAIPVVVVAGEVLLTRREWGTVGIHGAYAVAEGVDAVSAAMADPVRTLTSRLVRVAGTWSR